MNLVSKEGPVLNERDGVVVLSTKLGAYEQLREVALGVDPSDDIEGTAEALHEASCSCRPKSDTSALFSCAVASSSMTSTVGWKYRSRPSSVGRPPPGYPLPPSQSRTVWKGRASVLPASRLDTTDAPCVEYLVGGAS